jgi:hypothetical protein
MGKGSRIRRLRPSELARQDQNEAAARELGRRDPKTAVIMTVYAAKDTRCSWCDCPTIWHEDPDYICPSCPRPAQYVIQMFKGQPEETHLPVCKRHYIDCAQDVQRQLRGPDGNPIPGEVRVWPVLDEEVAR